jgi:hypothetical protein
MGWLLIPVLLGLAALVVGVARSRRPHPRHEFILEMAARLAPGGVVRGFSPLRDDRDRAAS